MNQLLSEQERAYFYSPLSFLHKQEKRLAENFLMDLANQKDVQLQQYKEEGVWLMIRYLHWDSQHFNCPTYRIDFSGWDREIPSPAESMARALVKLCTELSARHTYYYLFAETPSEDLMMLQAMGFAGLRLIETRMSYFHDNLENFDWPSRFPVRAATEIDIPHLRQVAMLTRNRYDRFHADPFFSEAVADEYLATFIENSIKGFADMVLIPAIDDSNLPGAFFTANLMPTQSQLSDLNVGRIVLVAVGEERRGWHLRLMVEMSYWLKEQKVAVAYMTTQSTNRAVIHNCEKLGYKYGRATHLFAIHG